MSNFQTKEWTNLCKRTRRSARYYSEMQPDMEKTISQECETFCSLDPPKGYPELLERTTQARDLAVRWMDGNRIDSATERSEKDKHLNPEVTPA